MNVYNARLGRWSDLRYETIEPSCEQLEGQQNTNTWIGFFDPYRRPNTAEAERKGIILFWGFMFDEPANIKNLQ